MKTLNIGDLKARIPIIQGGMGVGISLSGLASAVAKEGGIGVISAAGLGLLYKKLCPDNFHSIASRPVISLEVPIALCQHSTMPLKAILKMVMPLTAVTLGGPLVS